MIALISWKILTKLSGSAESCQHCEMPLRTTSPNVQAFSSFWCCFLSNVKNQISESQNVLLRYRDSHERMIADNILSKRIGRKGENAGPLISFLFCELDVDKSGYVCFAVALLSCFLDYLVPYLPSPYTYWHQGTLLFVARPILLLPWLSTSIRICLDAHIGEYDNIQSE